MNTAFPLPRWLQGREPLTVGIIAINVGVWLASVLVGGLNILSPSPADLQRWGGNIAALSLTSRPRATTTRTRTPRESRSSSTATI